MPVPSESAVPWSPSERINAPYRSGKVKTWLKTKNPKAVAWLRVQEGGW